MLQIVASCTFFGLLTLFLVAILCLFHADIYYHSLGTLHLGRKISSHL